MQLANTPRLMKLSGPAAKRLQNAKRLHNALDVDWKLVLTVDNIDRILPWSYISPATVEPEPAVITRETSVFDHYRHVDGFCIGLVQS